MTIYSGEFSTPGTSAEVTLVLEVVQGPQSVEGNYTDAFWEFRMVEHVNASPSRNWHDCGAYADIGERVFESNTLDYNFDGVNETIVIAGVGTRRIYHEPDGTAEVLIGAAYDGKTPLGYAELSGVFVPDPIPRASTPTYSDTTPDAGDAITITTNRADSSFTHDLARRWQGSTGGYTSIATGVGASTSWTVPSTLVNDIPNATTRVLEIRTTTKKDGVSIGTSLTYITVRVPDSIEPDFGTVTHAEAVTSPDVGALIGGYVRGVSKLTLAISSAVAGDGATVKKKQVQVRSGSTVLQTVDVTAGAAVTPLPLSASGTLTLRGIVTDSRNRTHSEDVTITVLPYATPVATAVGLARCLSDGTVDEGGTRFRVNLTAAVQSLTVASTQKNALTYRISTRPQSGGSWTVKETTTPGGITFNSFAVVGTYLLNASYEVKVEVYDKLTAANPYVVTGTVSTAGVFIHFGNRGQGIGIGAVWQERDPAKPASIDALNWLYQGDGNRVLDVSEIASSAETIAGSSSRLVTPAGLAAARSAFARGRNLLRNAQFRVNQYGWGGSGTIANGAYFIDGWKNASGTGTGTITVSSGDSDTRRNIQLAPADLRVIEQTIERRELGADGPASFVLGNSGNAQGRAYNLGDTAPAWATLPAVFELDNAANVIVQFRNHASDYRYVSRPFLIRAEAWDGHFPDISYTEDLLWCQRFYETGAAKHYESADPYTAIDVQFRVPKRAAPTLTYAAPPGGSSYLPTSTDWIDENGFAAIRSTSSQIAFKWTASAEL